ncbi:MAG: GNAT family N-acetyltransferase [Corynebacterium sp.]|nr:GNAT family N-acetyltransferase [Corynebacterium sp.]
MEIRQMQESDYPAVCDIYALGVAGHNASYRFNLPATYREFISSKIEELALVSVNDEGEVTGWATVRPGWWPWTVENSLYVGVPGQGIGTALLEELVARCAGREIGAIHALIFPENKASIRTHEKAGFIEVGTLRRAVHMDERWRDAYLMEYLVPSALD